MALRQLWSHINDQLYLGHTHTCTKKRAPVWGIVSTNTEITQGSRVPRELSQARLVLHQWESHHSNRCPQSAWEEGENRSTKGKTRCSPPERSRCIISIVYQKAYKTYSTYSFLGFYQHFDKNTPKSSQIGASVIIYHQCTTDPLLLLRL